jgi:hypothetical protein
LISEGVSTDNDWFFPSRYQFGYIFDDDRFSEDSSVEDVSDGTVGAFPHFFEVELLDSGFIWRDGCAFDAYFALLNGLGGLEGDIIIGGISVLNR